MLNRMYIKMDCGTNAMQCAFGDAQNMDNQIAIKQGQGSVH